MKLKAQNLRKNGLSVRSIQKQLNVSRSSVSLWTRDIKLTKKQLKKLYLNKKTGALKGSIVAARNAQKRRKLLTIKLFQEGEKEIGDLSERDKFLIGISLYFAEGSKTDKNVSFSNSDYRSIKFMMNWFRRYCYVSKDKFRGSLYLHDNLDEGQAKNFWSKSTHIPLDQFTKTYIVKNKEFRFRKTKHEFGIFRIVISDVNLNRKIMGWISGIFQNL